MTAAIYGRAVRMERDTAISVQRAAIGALQARLAPSSARRAVQATDPSDIVPCALDGAPYPRTPRGRPLTARPHPCSAVPAHAGPSAHAVPAVARTRATGRYGATAARCTARGNSGAPLSLETGRAARCNASFAHAGPCEGIGVEETRARTGRGSSAHGTAHGTAHESYRANRRKRLRMDVYGQSGR